MLIYFIIIYNILKFFNIGMLYTIYIIVISYIPLFGIYFTVNNEDNIIELLHNIIKYILKPKRYLNYYNYGKENIFVHKTKNYISCKKRK